MSSLGLDLTNIDHIVTVTNMVSTVCLDAWLWSVNITGHGTAQILIKYYRGFIVKDLDASSYPKKLLQCQNLQRPACLIVFEWLFMLIHG